MGVRSYSLDRQARLISTAIAIGIGVLFAVAVFLEPDTRGYGTHQQLGLPECLFLQATGLKCPQCGMTTSFACVVRGQWMLAWNANPCGPILAAMLSVVVFPWCLIAGFSGRSVVISQPGLTMILISGFYLLIAVIVWLIRTVIS